MPRLPHAILSLLALLVALALPASAAAAGSPDIALTAEVPQRVLLGEDAAITLRAHNPGGQPYGFNLSFRDELPAGVTYRPGSARYGGLAVAEPAIVATGAGGTALIWRNVGDLSPGSTGVLTYEVEHATTGATAYAVGETYTHQPAAYISSDERVVPAFAGAGGAYSAGATGSSVAPTATTALSAIEIEVRESSPEGEILRGAHDHQTVFTLHLRNNGVAPTTGLTVNAYLPAGLEFLGCGDADNTTDAPTNAQAGAEEWPGSGSLSGNAAAPSPCPAPTAVQTVTVDPDGAGPLPSAVYTRVTWAAADLLAAGTADIRYLAAIPIRRNTATWTGATPAPASLGQAANLDNNSGTETQDEDPLTTYATVAGDYDGTIPTGDDHDLTRTAEDIRVVKTASQGAINDGQETRWSLALATGEYRFVDGIVVTDTVPDGLCPLDTPALDADSDCAAGTPPTADYTSAAENANGTWTLVWNQSTDAALARMAPSTTHTIEFSTRSRSHYQENGADQAPVLARDRWTNAVGLTGADHVRCAGDADCGTAPGGPYDPFDAAKLDHDEPDGTLDADASSASQTADAPSIDKRVRAAGGAVPADCSGGTYVDGPAGPYAPGDRICFRLHVDFPDLLDTGGPIVTDFLPDGVTYESYTLTGANTVAVRSFTGAPGDGTVAWELGDGDENATNGQVFEVLLAARVTDPEAGQHDEVKGNLMKFSYANSDGESFPLRDAADFTWAEPELTLTEGVRDIDGAPVGGNGPDVDGGTVQAGDVVAVRIDVTNGSDRAAADAEIWEELPDGVTCADVSAVSAGGACLPGDTRITWTGIDVAGDATVTLTYAYTIPPGARPATTFSHHAGVRSYQDADNAGGTTTYHPAANIDPAVTAGMQNAGEADDTTFVATGTPTLTYASASGDLNQTANATIGERILWTATATLPAGTTFQGTSGPATLTIPLGTKQTYLPGTVTATLNGGALPGGFVVDDTGNTITVTFPANYDTGAGADSLVVAYRATVDDESQNKRTAGQTLTTTATLAYATGAGAAQSPQASSTQTIVEPNLTAAKDDNDPDDRIAPGDTVRYTVTLTNPTAPGRVSTAYDVVLVDTVPAGLTPVDAGGNPVADGAGVQPTSGTWNATARTVTWTAAALAGGGTATFAYDVDVDDPQVGNANKTNAVVATATSYPSAQTLYGTERDATSAQAVSAAGYRATAAKTLRLAGLDLAKTVDTPTATVGAQRVYTLDVTVPGGLDFNDVTVRDLLPDGLVYEAGSFAATCVGGCALGATEIPPTVATTTQLGFWLGDIPAQAATRIVRITYSARVEATYAGGAPVSRTQTLVNTAAVHSNVSDTIGSQPSSVPAASAYSDKSADRARTVTVVEPQVTIDKDVSGQAGDTDTRPAQPGQSLTYTLTVANTGDAPAYDVVVDDLPDAELTGVTPVANAGWVTDGWTSGDPDVRWVIPTIAAGADVTLTYTAALAASGTLEEADSAVNTADATEYFGHPLAYRQANPGVTVRDYDDVTADTVTVAVELPRVEVDLTTGTSGFPESADAEVGQDFAWRAVVRNTSTVADARDADLVVRLPRNWTYTAGSSAGAGGEPAVTSDPAGDLLTWANFTHLGPSASQVVTFAARPTLPAKADAGLGGASPHVATASVTADDMTGATASSDGPYADGPDPAQAILRAPDLTIAKTPEDGDVDAGTTGTWTITVGNAGDGTARDVRVTDTIPAGVTYAAGTATSADPGFAEESVTANGDGTVTVVWSLSDLDPADPAVTITVPVAVPASDDADTIHTNTATVAATEQPSGPADTGALHVRTAADLGVVKTADPVATDAGELVTWTMTVTNDGPSDARDSELSDALPAGVTFDAFVAGATDCTHLAGVIACDFGTIAPGGMREVQVRTRLAPSLAVGSVVTNTAAVTTSTPDPVSADDSDSADVTIGGLADLRVTKTARGTGETPLGQQIVYDLGVANDGPSDAEDVTLSDPLPAGTSFVSLTAPAGWSCTTPAIGASGTGTCTVPALPADAAAAFVVTVRADAVGLQANTATADATTPDPEPGNDADGADVTVVPAADLAVAKAGPATVAPDTDVAFTLTATNEGPSAATGVVVTDTLPEGLTFVSAAAERGTCAHAARIVTCAVGALAVGESVAITVSAHAEFAIAGQTVLNGARVDGTEADVDPANDTDTHPVTVGPAADLSVEKLAPERVPAENQLPYTLRVANAGPSAATAVRLTDTLPTGLRLVEATATQGTCTADGQAVTCELGTVAPGAQVVVTLVTEVAAGTAGAELRNAAEVVAAEPDPDPADNRDEVVTTVELPIRTAGSLSVTKTTAADGPVVLGEPVQYTITVRNGTDRPATGVAVLDTPTGKHDVVSVVPQQGTCDATKLECRLGTVAAGADVTVAVTLIPQGTGTLTNTAAVSSDQGDRDGTDNSDQAGITVQSAPTRLKVVKTAARRAVQAGGTVRFKLRVTNVGSRAAEDVRVCDAPQAGLSFVKAAGARLQRGRMCWTVAYWPAGASRTYTVTTRVNRGRRQAVNRAIVQSAGNPSASDRARIRVRGRQARGGGVTG